jgi:hypothetical protein
MAGCLLAVAILAAGRAQDGEQAELATIASTVDSESGAVTTVMPAEPQAELFAQMAPTGVPREVVTQPQPVATEPQFVTQDAGGPPWTDNWIDATFDDAFPPIWSHWTVNFDALLWRRSTPSGMPLARTTTLPVPDAANLTFDHEGGPRLAIIRRGISGWDVELNYMGIESWHSPLVMPEDADPRIPGDDPGGLYTQDVNLFVGGLAIDYRTTLHSEELNFRRALNQTWTGLVGFRALQLHERYDTVDIFGFPFYTISTDNRLYGFQVGGEGRVFGTERFGLLTVFKAGLFENNSEQLTTDFSGILAGPTSPSDLTASDNQASFMGEIGLWGIIRISETIFIRAGYNIMWIDDVALAVKQIPENEFVTFGLHRPLEGIATDGHLVIHGASLGVELSW